MRGVGKPAIVLALMGMLAVGYVSGGFSVWDPTSSPEVFVPMASTTVEAGTNRSVFVGQPVTLSGAATPGDVSVPLWNDSFDPYSTGPLTSPWVDQSTGSNYAEIDATVFLGGSGKSLHLFDASSVDGANAFRGLANPVRLDLTVWLRAETTTGAGTIVLNSPSAWGTVRLGLGPNGMFVYHICSPSFPSTAMSYSAGTWYEIRLVADAATDTYDLYVDGVLLVDNDSFCVNASYLNGVVLNSGGDQVGEYNWDDIRVATLQPAQIQEYRWDFDGSVDADSDGNATNDQDGLGPTVTTTYGTPRSYLATITVLDSTMAFANDTVWITVAVPSPSPTLVDAGPSVSSPEGQPFPLAAVIVPGAVWQEAWEDNFDTYPPGPLPAPWTDRSTGPNSAVVSSAIHKGASGNSLYLFDSSPLDGANAERTLGASATALDVTAWFYPTSTNSLGTIVLNSDTLWGAVRVGLGPSGRFVYDVCGAGYTSTTRSYLSATWYEVRVVADASTDRYDMYVNGSLEVSQASFCGAISSFDHIWLSAGGNSVGNFYVDDVTTWARTEQVATEYRWDLDGARDADGDGNFTDDPDALGPNPSVVLGDNGVYLVTLTVTMSGGTRHNDSLWATVSNVSPVATPSVPSVVSISTGVQASVRLTDPGSDDLNVEWRWTDGIVASSDYLNGAGADPPHSPWGTFPFVVDDNAARGFPAPGIYGLSIRVEDDDSGISWTNRTVDVRDVPLTTVAVGQPRYSGTFLYVNASSTITLSGTDRSGFGIAATFFRIDGGAVTLYTAPLTLTTAGLRNVTYWSTDNLGGIEPPKFLELYVDVSPPVTMLEIQGPYVFVGGTQWIAPATALWINGTDSEAGLNETWYRYEVSASWSSWAPVPAPLAPPVAGGRFGLEYYSQDNLGQSEVVSATAFSVDGDPPVSTLSLGVPVSGAWVSSLTALSLQASDSGIGIAATFYRTWHAGAWSSLVTYGAVFTLGSGEGQYFVEYYSVDLIGNVEITHNASLFVDDSPPETRLDVAGSQIQVAGTLWAVPTALLWLNATDGGAGANGTFVRFRVDGSWSAWTLEAGPSPPPVANGSFVIEFYSVDRLGHVEATDSLSMAIDGTPPTSTASAGTPVWGQWITSQTSIAISASDGFGVGLAITRYRTWHDSVYSPFSPYSEAFRLLQGEGTTIVEYESEDLLGNREALQSVRFDVDDTPPNIDQSIRFSSEDYEFTISASAEDLGSGLASLEYRIADGPWGNYTGPVTVHTRSSVDVEFRAADHLGNVRIEPLSGIEPKYVNLKPLLSVVLASAILAVSLFLYRDRHSRLVLATGVAFAVAEAVCGVASWAWGILLFPPAAGIGLAVNLGITVMGVAVVVQLGRRAAEVGSRGQDEHPQASVREEGQVQDEEQE